MTKFRLHYAPIDLISDIESLEFESYEELAGYTMASANYDMVYLISIFDYVFVSESIDIALSFYGTFKNVKIKGKEIDVYFQEYKSYEDAYRSALDMMEISELCYN